MQLYERSDDDEEASVSADRLRRSCHFVPGANEKMLTKSIASNADCLILDLEDAVTPDRKDDARIIVNDWLGEADFQGKERTVRMNPLDTPWGLKDLEVTMQNAPDAYVVPKVSTLAELNTMKEDGNQLFRTGSYAEAIHKYDVIIERLENGKCIFNKKYFCQLDGHPVS